MNSKHVNENKIFSAFREVFIILNNGIPNLKLILI